MLSSAGKDFLMLLPGELHQAHQRTMSGCAAHATGRNLEQLPILQHFFDTTHPEDSEARLNTFRQCRVKDEALDMEYRILWPDNSVLWIHLAGELANDDSGSPVCMAGVPSDLKAKKNFGWHHYTLRTRHCGQSDQLAVCK